MGLVPRELESLFPACCYDVPVTGHWSGEEREMLREMLRWYLRAFSGRVVCYAGGAYAEVAESLGIEVVARESLLSAESLERLEQRVAEHAAECRCGGGWQARAARCVADFQFGRGAGEALVPEGAVVRGGRVFYGERLAAELGSGGLRLRLPGARRLAEACPEYAVELNFMPKSRNVLAPGVVRAGEMILPGDEVAAVYEGRTVGAGRALMSGGEMHRATRGVCVELREFGG